MTKFTSSLYAISAGLVALNQVQAGVTIYEPIPTDPAIIPSVNVPEVIGVSAIAVVSGGATQYAATQVASALAVGETTVTFSPTTYVVTIEEGASTYHVLQATTTTISGQAIVISDDRNCGPGGNGKLSCVEKAAVSVAGAPPTTVTETYAATESPVFTITGSTGPLPTAKNSAIHTTPLMVSGSLFMGFVYALVCIL